MAYIHIFRRGWRPWGTPRTALKSPDRWSLRPCGKSLLLMSLHEVIKKILPAEFWSKPDSSRAQKAASTSPRSLTLTLCDLFDMCMLWKWESIVISVDKCIIISTCKKNGSRHAVPSWDQCQILEWTNALFSFERRMEIFCICSRKLCILHVYDRTTVIREVSIRPEKMSVHTYI